MTKLRTLSLQRSVSAHILSKMAASTRVRCVVVAPMEKEKLYIRMVISMKVNMSKGNAKEKAPTIFLMVNATKVNGFKIYSMEEELTTS